MGDTNRKRAARKAERLSNDLREVGSTAAGIRVFRALLEGHGVHRTSYVPGSPTQTAFNEGDRNAGLRLMALLDEADPSIYQRIINLEQEQKNNERRERERAAADRGGDGDEPGHADG